LSVLVVVVEGGGEGWGELEEVRRVSEDHLHEGVLWVAYSDMRDTSLSTSRDTAWLVNRRTHTLESCHRHDAAMHAGIDAGIGLSWEYGTRSGVAMRSRASCVAVGWFSEA
jgi:hypothetical protein